MPGVECLHSPIISTHGGFKYLTWNQRGENVYVNYGVENIQENAFNRELLVGVQNYMQNHKLIYS